MEINELLGNLTTLKKNTDQAIRLLKNVSRLSGDLGANLLLLKSNLTKLEILAGKYSKEDPIFRAILAWIENHNKEISVEKERLKDQFGIVLERELITQGCTLIGNYPKFTAGFFTIETNHQKWSSKIWYGPKQELLDTCSFSASLVASRIKIARETLGARMPENSFLDLLYKIYINLVQGKQGEAVPINKILPELQNKLNPINPEAKDSSTGSRVKVYGRADFSYDLFRTRALVDHPELIVATRAFTQKRADFLWIPVDEMVKGATYSHLKFKEK